MKIKKKIQLNNTVTLVSDIATKHNLLSEIMKNNFVQLAGQISTFQKMFEQVNTRLGSLEKDIRSVSFHSLKVQAENIALKECFSNNVSMEKYPIVLNNIMKREFMVDSANVPVGILKVNCYDE